MTTKAETHTHIKRLYLTIAEQFTLYTKAKDMARMQLKIILTYCDDTINPKTRLTILTRKIYASLIRALLIENCFCCSRQVNSIRTRHNTIVFVQEYTDTFDLAN